MLGMQGSTLITISYRYVSNCIDIFYAILKNIEYMYNVIFMNCSFAHFIVVWKGGVGEDQLRGALLRGG